MNHDPMLIEPQRLVSPGAWVGHIPFISWLISVQRPALIVELGTHTGNSYSAICQAVVENELAATAFAVDTWQGDEHAGQYSDEVFAEFSAYHDSHYSGFSTLLRMTFDEALDRFADQSIDLLHIDGLHTYEAVKHDFETWQPKLSSRAIVLFHDTNVFERNFGVHQLWQELSSQYPGFNFLHCHGLGVLLVGPDRLEMLVEHFASVDQPDDSWSDMAREFGLLGQRLEVQVTLAEHLKHKQSLLDHVSHLDHIIATQQATITQLQSAASAGVANPVRVNVLEHLVQLKDQQIKGLETLLMNVSS